MASPADMRRERIAAALLAICIVGSVLAIGSVHVASLIVLGGLVAAAVVMARRLRSRGSRGFPAPALVLLGLAGFCLLQALPLPAALVGWLAPNAADIQARVLLPLGEPGPSWTSLSLDQGATLVEALKWTIYAGVFYVADVVGERRGVVWTVRVVFVAALLAALATLLHGLAGMTKVYGLFEPSYQPEIWHVGPLLNPNNLAGYLNLGAMCGIGIGLHRDHKIPYTIAWPGVALIIAVAVLSASRGGVLFLALGLAALAIALSTRKLEGKRSRRPELYAMAAAVVVGLGLALLGGTQDSWSELYDNNVSKLGLAERALPMIQDHPWFGVGRGAFESTFTAYHYGYENRVFAHAENWVMQWVAEWGVVATVAAVGALAWMFRPARMDLRREVGLAAYIGVAMLVIHNFVDLGLELAGVTVALTALLGSLHGGTRRDERKRTRRRRLVSSRVSHWGYAGAVAVVAVLVLVWGRHDVAGERRALADRYRQLDAGAAQEVAGLRASLRDAMLRHPAEPYFPLLGATMARRFKDQDAMPWIQRALERGMGHGRTHLLLAQILSERGLHAQARLELRMATGYSPELGRDAVPIALRSSRNITQLKETVPAGEPGVQMLGALATALRDKKDEHSTALRIACDEAALEYDASLIVPHVRLADDTIAALKERRAPCVDNTAACEQRVIAHVTALERAAPNHSYAAQVRARLLAATGELEQADALLAKRCAEVEDRKPCLLERTHIASAGTIEAFAGAVKELLAAGCGSYSECASTHTWIGNRYQERKDWPAAYRHFMKAAQVQPRPQHWLAVATAASKAGLHGKAVEALEKVLRDRKHRDDEALKKRLAEERLLMASSFVGTP